MRSSRPRKPRFLAHKGTYHFSNLVQPLEQLNGELHVKMGWLVHIKREIGELIMCCAQLNGKLTTLAIQIEGDNR